MMYRYCRLCLKSSVLGLLGLLLLQTGNSMAQGRGGNGHDNGRKALQNQGKSGAGESQGGGRGNVNQRGDSGTNGGAISGVGNVPRSAPGIGRTGDGGRIVLQTVPTSIVGNSNRFRNTYVYRYPTGTYSRLVYTPYPAWIYPYFVNGIAFYPYYVSTFTLGYTSWSPYFYYGVLPLYISNDNVELTEPKRGYLNYANAGTDANNYYLLRHIGLPTNIQQQRAIGDISDSWLMSNISPIGLHTRANVRIGVYLQGTYKYSMTANDYLDITHDAQRCMTTRAFTLRMVATPAPGVIVLSGEHRYADRHNVERTVRVDYALRLVNGTYTIIEVGVGDSYERSKVVR